MTHKEQNIILDLYRGMLYGVRGIAIELGILCEGGDTGEKSHH